MARSHDREIVRLAVPAFLALVAEPMFLLTDAAIIGHLGTAPLAGLGIADLPDGIEGVHGLESEAEDIRGHLIQRADLTGMAMAGQLTNGPLAMIALWLELRRDAIRADLGMA